MECVPTPQPIAPAAAAAVRTCPFAATKPATFGLITQKRAAGKHFLFLMIFFKKGLLTSWPPDLAPTYPFTSGVDLATYPYT